ncbi:unnamed protein product [Strongylus vulgaris]|uniref:Uncharacterized protein n=1 Tax=Strongylus vulgaris TaxID=40348 RepID=A0A3P7LGN3_STRVU|nr:unnamed protein product [Strongylus vulgaris]
MTGPNRRTNLAKELELTPLIHKDEAEVSEDTLHKWDEVIRGLAYKKRTFGCNYVTFDGMNEVLCFIK